MVRKAMIALALLSSGTRADPLPEWEQPHMLDLVNKALAAMAHTCATDFGFTEVPRKSVSEERDALDAYLMLSGDGELQESEWLDLMQKRNQLVGKNGSVASRASDALGAAVDDPSSYGEAEKLYVSTVMQGERDVMAECTKAASDPYIGKHFLTGQGTPSESEAKLKRDFADGVMELTAYKARVMPKRK